jgi:hypothetical protein
MLDSRVSKSEGPRCRLSLIKKDGVSLTPLRLAAITGTVSMVEAVIGITAPQAPFRRILTSVRRKSNYT